MLISMPIKVFKEGEKSKAICDTCGEVVDTTLRKRNYYVPESDITVPDLLVGVCDICDGIVSIPHSSVHTIVNYTNSLKGY